MPGGDPDARGSELAPEALARAHRRLGEELHAVEDHLLDVADRLDDPEPMRDRARQLSADADRLLEHAEQLDGAPHRIVDPPTSGRQPAARTGSRQARSSPG